MNDFNFTKIIQSFLILIGQMSYIEQAPGTNHYTTSFLDFFRYYTSTKTITSLYHEIYAINLFIDIFKSNIYLLNNFSIHNKEEYKGFFLDHLSVVHFFCTSLDTIQGNPNATQVSNFQLDIDTNTISLLYKINNEPNPKILTMTI